VPGRQAPPLLHFFSMVGSERGHHSQLLRGVPRQCTQARALHEVTAALHEVTAVCAERPQRRGALSQLWDAIAGVQRGAESLQGADSAQHGSNCDTLYLPTGSLQLFRSLHSELPEHHLVAADFSHFAPGDVRLRGTNAPIVSCTVRCYRLHACLPHIPVCCRRCCRMLSCSFRAAASRPRVGAPAHMPRTLPCHEPPSTLTSPLTRQPRRVCLLGHLCLPTVPLQACKCLHLIGSTSKPVHSSVAPLSHACQVILHTRWEVKLRSAGAWSER
jgi:hypothetical protein